MEQGPIAGGTTVWLTGFGFPSDVIVRFGDADCAFVISSATNLIKCTSPPSSTLESRRRRKEVDLQLHSASTGVPVACSFTFTYVQEPDQLDVDLLRHVYEVSPNHAHQNPNTYPLQLAGGIYHQQCQVPSHQHRLPIVAELSCCPVSQPCCLLDRASASYCEC